MNVTIIGDDIREETEIFYAIFTPQNGDIFANGLNYVKISLVDSYCKANNVWKMSK